MVKRMKCCIVLCVCLMTSVSVFAQWPTRNGLHYYYPTNNWKDNIYISIGGGGIMTLSSENLKGSLGDIVKPHFYLKAGKSINPFWGFRGAVTMGGSSEKLASTSVETVRFMSLRADLLCNLVNAFGAYKRGVHLVDFYLFAGPYINIPFGEKANPGISFGGLLKFNVNEYLAIDLEGRFSRQNSVVFHEFDRFYSAATIGISYTFGGKKF